jgi:hypothetical protein
MCERLDMEILSNQKRTGFRLTANGLARAVAVARTEAWIKPQERAQNVVAERDRVRSRLEWRGEPVGVVADDFLVADGRQQGGRRGHAVIMRPS